MFVLLILCRYAVLMAFAAGVRCMPPWTEGLSHREPKNACIPVGRRMQGPWNVGSGTIRAAMQTGPDSLPIPWTSRCPWALGDSEVSDLLPFSFLNVALHVAASIVLPICCAAALQAYLAALH